MAALEEYLQEEYVKYYEDEENYTNKPELLANKINNLFLKNGSLNYVVSSASGTLSYYYLINKSSLPQEIQDGLLGGDTTDYGDYINFIDVYGVTSDLKVYYCQNGLNDGTIGNISGVEVAADTPAKKVNSNMIAKEAIADALGIDKDAEITLQDVQKVKTLELSSINSVDFFSEMYSLKNVILKNSTIANLDGIENCSLLEKITFYDTIVTDYSKLSINRNLNSVYLYLSKNIDEISANKQVENLCIGLKNSKANVKEFGISGDYTMLNYVDNPNTRSYHKNNYSDVISCQIGQTNKSNITNIDPLKELSTSILENITYLYLNNNRINEGDTNNNIDALKDFSSIELITLMNNSHLYNLNGLKNHNTIKTLFVYNCYYTENEIKKGLNDISGLSGLTGMTSLYLMNNLALTSLNGISEDINLKKLVAFSCDLTDISALSTLTMLNYLSLYSNVNLENISYLSTLINVRYLYLANNTKMNKSQFVSALDETGIIENCGINYSIPDEYKSLITSILATYDLSNQDLTDDSDIIQTFLGKSDLTNILKMNLKGNSKLTDETLQNILGKMKNVKGLSLNGLTNLESLSFISSGKATNIIELDLRGTKITDLSNLENYGTNLHALVIDNYNIDFSKIQKTINRMYDLYSAGIYSCVYNSTSDYSYHCSGLVLTGDGSKYTFGSNCTNIKKIFIGSGQIYSTQTGTVDFSNLPNLEILYFRTCNYKFLLPTGLKTYRKYDKYGGAGLSLCANLESITLDDANSNDLFTLSKIPATLNFSRGGTYDMSFFSREIDSTTKELVDCSQLTSINMGYSSTESKPEFTNFDSLIRATNLESLKITSCVISDISNITKFTNLNTLYIKFMTTTSITDIPLSNDNGTLSKLTSLTIASNTNFKRMNGLSNISTLEDIYINNTSISDITGLSNNTKLASVILCNNIIADLSEFDKLIENCDGTVNFSSINLSNNSLDYYSSNGNDNVQTILNLYNAGCTSINISGNNLANSPRLQGISGIIVD